MLKLVAILTAASSATLAVATDDDGSQPFVFDRCSSGPRQPNQTAQECVGQLILDTLTKATEDPENFFGINELDNDGGIMRLIKLKYDNDTVAVDHEHYDIDESRSSNTASFWDQIVYAFKKLTNYSSDHGLLVSLPQWSRKISPVSVIDEDDMVNVVSESRTKRPHKKYALLFPMLATFKFLLIKVLLVPILLAVLVIKKLMILGIMALPTVLTMLRFCRNPNFPGFGGGFGNLVAAGQVGPIGQAAAFAPLTADMSGDYSTYVQQAAAASQHNGGGAYKDYSKNLIDAMKGTYRRR